MGDRIGPKRQLTSLLIDGIEGAMGLSDDDLYSFFDLPSTSTDDELRSAYRDLLLKYHPDRNPDAIESATRKTQEIINAYDQLKRRRKLHTSPEAELAQPSIQFVYKTPEISLELIASLKEELRNAWKAFNERQCVVDT
jgi:curved DNA-binding protein CbpA